MCKFVMLRIIIYVYRFLSQTNRGYFSVEYVNRSGAETVIFREDKHELTLFPAWITNYIHYGILDEITYPFPNFNGEPLKLRND